MVTVILLAAGLALLLFGVKFTQSSDVKQAMAKQQRRRTLPALPGLAALILGTALILAAINELI